MVSRYLYEAHSPFTWGGAHPAPDGGDAWAPRPDETLIRALARAHRWKRLLEGGRHRSAAGIAEAESVELRQPTTPVDAALAGYRRGDPRRPSGEGYGAGGTDTGDAQQRRVEPESGGRRARRHGSRSDHGRHRDGRDAGSAALMSSSIMPAMA